jgi:hypothetical protein
VSGDVAGAIDRDNQASFSLIITDNQAFSPLLSQPFQF